MFETVKTLSDGGREIECAVVVGAREESASELVLLGEFTSPAITEPRGFFGGTWVREGRDEPDAQLFWADNEEPIDHDAAIDIVTAITVEMDTTVNGILQQEMNRILSEDETPSQTLAGHIAALDGLIDGQQDDLAETLTPIRDYLQELLSQS